jgi:hypothetical protein
MTGAVPIRFEVQPTFEEMSEWKRLDPSLPRRRAVSAKTHFEKEQFP